MPNTVSSWKDYKDNLHWDRWQHEGYIPETENEGGSCFILAVFNHVMLNAHIDIHYQNEISTLCSIMKDFLFIQEKYLHI